MGFYEEVSGARMHSAYIRPGGIAMDLPIGFFERLEQFVVQFGDRIFEIEILLSKNRIWVQRLLGIGTVTKAEALSFGYSGVMLRSAGVRWDLRKTTPYEIYSLLDFNIP